MRLSPVGLFWASTALGTAAALSAASVQLLPAEPQVLAAGSLLGGGSAEEARPPATPDPTLSPVVLAAVARAGGVDLAGGGSCPADRLVVSWDDPGPGWRSGGFIAPLGPAPTLRADAVNGVVLCQGSHHAYVGFDAVRTVQGWDVELVPDPAGGVDDEAAGTNDPDTAPVPSPRPPTPLLGLAAGAAIEGYARYEGQTRCDPTAKKGTLALRDLLLARYPSTRSLGISRSCGVGGRSEHKEGRAFDWGANLGVAAERAAAQDFLAHLFATDSHGNRHALVRRMGLMYVIWNHQIWSAYRADAGWRPYSGSSPHTDHVHMSLSWAGAQGLTSFWSGDVVEGLSPVPVGGGAGNRSAAATHTAHPGTADGSRDTAYRRHRPQPTPSASSSPSPSPSPRENRPVWDGVRDGTGSLPDPVRTWSRDRQRSWSPDPVLSPDTSAWTRDPSNPACEPNSAGGWRPSCRPSCRRCRTPSPWLRSGR